MSLQLLHDAFARRKHHFVPFFVLGDPDPDTSTRLIISAVEAGATQLELGIPFSDPVADGPAIRSAGERARARGTTVASALELLATIRSRVDVPLNLLVYGNLVHARGYADFARDLASAGASSLLVPDIPSEESAPLRAACAAVQLGFVHLLAPTTPSDRATRLAEEATAFVYMTGVQGVTGSRSASNSDSVARIAGCVCKPIAVGFGIRRPHDVRRVLDAGASAAVAGSVLARRIDLGLRREADANALVADVGARIRRLAAPAHPLTEGTPCSS